MRRFARRLIILSAALAAAVGVMTAGIALAAGEHGRAVLAAESDAAAVATVVEASTSHETLREAVARTATGRDGRLAVRIDGHSAVGTVYPIDTDGAVSERHVFTLDGRDAVIETVVPAWHPTAGFLELMALLTAIGVGAVVLAAVIGRRLATPAELELNRLVEGGWSIARGGPWTPSRAEVLPEVAELDRVLRAITAHADTLRISERELISDLSHRLRTPLTSLALDAEAIGDSEVAQRIRKAVDTLNSDVDAIIRATKPTEILPSYCDAVAVVRERMTFWAALAEHAARCCSVNLSPRPAMVSLTSRDLGAVVDALLGNVFGHTADACAIAVSVVRYAGWVTLVVEDAGPGVADPVAALRRGASGGGSTGLGLAIARSAAEATGGTIHIERGKLGGARIRMRLREVGIERAGANDPRAWRLWPDRSRGAAG